MPIEDTIKIVTAIYLYSPDAPDLAFSYLWGTNAGYIVYNRKDFIRVSGFI
jgi:hypothetical protein